MVSEKVRAAREMLSATRDAPAGLGKLLREVENDLRMAQATLGGELEFSLCPRCWPPELVATDLVGGYASQFRWADGHSTGIYSFDYLRKLAAGTS